MSKMIALDLVAISTLAQHAHGTRVNRMAPSKDVIPRYQTMKGRKVNRVFGWDTHGLPAELEAQKAMP